MWWKIFEKDSLATYEGIIGVAANERGRFQLVGTITAGNVVLNVVSKVEFSSQEHAVLAANFGTSQKHRCEWRDPRDLPLPTPFLGPLNTFWNIDFVDKICKNCGKVLEKGTKSYDTGYCTIRCMAKGGTTIGN